MRQNIESGEGVYSGPVFSSGALPDEMTLEAEMAESFGWDDQPSPEEIEEEYQAYQLRRAAELAKAG